MLKRGLLLFFLLQPGIFNTLQAQTKTNSCLFISEPNKYILTEKIKHGDGHYETVNSLFIWENDKVIRIVFLYDQKLARLSKNKIAALQTFDDFLPTFKSYTWQANTKYGSRRITYPNISIYNGNFTDNRKGETSGRYYEVKLKTAINARNKRYNPLADKFGEIVISDGEPEVMIYNPYRKAKAINNLPMLFNSAKGDSSYVICPLHIDIYKLDNSEKPGGATSLNFKGYKLFSTVSFLQQSVTYPEEKFIEEPYKSQKYFIVQHTLPYLYQTSQTLDTISIRNSVGEIWHYAFSDKYRRYFKVKITNLNGPLSRDVYYAWLLASPGVGYWMSDVGVNNKEYSIDGAKLFLSGTKAGD